MIKKDIKLFATDLDGTLFARPGHLTKYAAETLRTLRAQGTRIAICTGRHYERILNGFPKDIYDYIVSNNGQDIYFVNKKEHISFPVLTKEEIHNLLPLAEKYPVILMASTDKDFLTTGSKKNYIALMLFRLCSQIRDFIQYHHFHHAEIDFNLENLENKYIIKICFSGTAGTLKRLAKEIPKDKYSVFFVNSNWLEVQPHGINKGNGLRMIMERENILPEQVCAIGDGENDLSMLEVAGVKVAMGNAMPCLKEIATDHAEHYFQEGCANWIRKNLL